MWLSCPADAFQLEYGLHDPGLAATIDKVDFGGRGVIARSVLAHGMITSGACKQNPYALEDHRHRKWSTQFAEQAAQLGQRLRDRFPDDINVIRAALSFASSAPNVSVTLVGARRPDHIDCIKEFEQAPYLADRRIVIEEALRTFTRHSTRP
jgi:aryl-alcohol dehydrogenase-like predicted oxidoreductase